MDSERDECGVRPSATTVALKGEQAEGSGGVEGLSCKGIMSP